METMQSLMIRLRTNFDKITKQNFCNKEFDLLPFSDNITIFRDRIKGLIFLLTTTFITSASLIGLQEFRLSKLSRQLTEKEYIIVPGAPEFMRVRPGFVPKESVYLFSEFIAAKLGTFSFGNMEAQYQSIANYMRPELKLKFLKESERKFQMVKDLRVDEIFEFEPVKDFKLSNDARGPKYEITVKGSTRRYVEGTMRESLPAELFLVTLRTTNVKSENPWFFEIEDLTRITPDELTRLEEAKNLHGRSSQ